MAVLKMRRISITALKKDRKEILDKLAALSVMEMDQLDPEGFSHEDFGESRLSCDGKARTIEQALSVLDEYAPEKTSALSSLEGKEILDRKDFDMSEEDEKSVMEKAEKILSLSRDLAEKKAEVQRLAQEAEQLAPWSLLGVPLSQETVRTEKTSLMVGTMPQGTTLEDVYMILEGVKEGIPYDTNVLEQDNDATYIYVICMTEDENEVESALRAGGFTRPQVSTELAPKDERDAIDKKIADLNDNEIEAVTGEIKKMAESRRDLRLLSDHMRLDAGEYDLISDLPGSDHSFVISGFIPENHIDAVQKAIGENYDCEIDIDDVKDDEDVPTVLKNNSFSSSMENVVQSYGLPNNKEFDPTTIMSFFYVFFFGLMLSDAAYGIVMTIVCFILLAKYKNMSESMHKQLKMFMFCGISTTFWGIMFGGYFGDLITVVAKTFFDKDVTVPAVWFVPLEDPMRLLMWCMAFGVVHLFVGLGIKGYEELKDGKKLDFFCDVVLWYMFLVGLLLMLLPSEIFKSISQMEISFPPAVNMLAKVLAIGGVLGIILMSGRDHKNPLLRLALGAYDVYGVTGWLSDVLSYSRLLALGLATGVIASVVNQMGSMAGGGIVGAVLFIIVFLIGHSMNMAINILGAYVHTNRLQFVEFFGKFYEGSGRPLEPFSQDTKYVEVKEEM